MEQGWLDFFEHYLETRCPARLADCPRQIIIKHALNQLACAKKPEYRRKRQTVRALNQC